MEDYFHHFDEIVSNLKSSNNSNNEPPAPRKTTASLEKWITFPDGERRYFIDKIIFHSFASSGRPKFISIHQVCCLFASHIHMEIALTSSVSLYIGYSLQDITELKKMETRLQEQSKDLESTANSLKTMKDIVDNAPISMGAVGKIECPSMPTSTTSIIVFRSYCLPT